MKISMEYIYMLSVIRYNYTGDSSLKMKFSMKYICMLSLINHNYTGFIS